MTRPCGDDDADNLAILREPADRGEAISLMKARRIEKAARHRCGGQADRSSDAEGYRAIGAAPGGLQG
jgi:hypothetical protein